MQCERVFQTSWSIHGMEKGVAVCCSEAWARTRPDQPCARAVTCRRSRGQCPAATLALRAGGLARQAEAAVMRECMEHGAWSNQASRVSPNALTVS